MVCHVPCAGQYCTYNTTSEVDVIEGFLGHCTSHSV